jgi:hypothetical protein
VAGTLEAHVYTLVLNYLQLVGLTTHSCIKHFKLGPRVEYSIWNEQQKNIIQIRFNPKYWGYQVRGCHEQDI